MWPVLLFLNYLSGAGTRWIVKNRAWPEHNVLGRQQSRVRWPLSSHIAQLPNTHSALPAPSSQLLSPGNLWLSMHVAAVSSVHLMFSFGISFFFGKCWFNKFLIYVYMHILCYLTTLWSVNFMGERNGANKLLGFFPLSEWYPSFCIMASDN